MTEYRCDEGHEFAAPTRPAICPQMVKGKKCEAAFTSGHYTASGKWVARQ